MTPPTISDHMEWMRYEGYADASTGLALKVLSRADRIMPNGLPDAEHDEIKEFLRQDGLANWTRRCYDQTLRRFFWWQVEVGERDDDPMRGLRRPELGGREPHPATHDQFKAALDRAEGPWYGAILLAGRQGLRADEAARQKREDITERLLTVRRGKGGKTRRVPTHPDTWAYVKDMPRGHIVQYRGEPVTGQWLSTRGAVYFRRIGLAGVHLHMFRAMLATEMVEAGVNLLVIQKMLGHLDVSTTMVYAGVTEEQMRRAVRALPALNENAPAGL